jgi:ABC-type bacteriocin/lantibiotic exporter with double-glycine peptidase domain
LRLAQLWQNFQETALSLERIADIILMMDRGTVAELVTHAKLMALRGRYYCLYQQQESQL